MTNDEAEKKVRKALDPLIADERLWGRVLDIVRARGLVAALRNERRRQGLTQAQLGELMGVGQGRVAEIENERYPDPRISTIARYATALGIRLNIDIQEIPQEPEAES